MTPATMGAHAQSEAVAKAEPASRRDEVEARFLAYLAVQIAQVEATLAGATKCAAIEGPTHADYLVSRAKLVMDAARRAVAGGAA